MQGLEKAGDQHLSHQIDLAQQLRREDEDITQRRPREDQETLAERARMDEQINHGQKEEDTLLVAAEEEGMIEGVVSTLLSGKLLADVSVLRLRRR